MLESSLEESDIFQVSPHMGKMRNLKSKMRILEKHDFPQTVPHMGSMKSYSQGKTDIFFLFVPVDKLYQECSNLMNKYIFTLSLR